MDDTEDMRTAVELYVYDLTKGMAAMMSRLLIGESTGVTDHSTLVNKFQYALNVSTLKGARLSVALQSTFIDYFVASATKQEEVRAKF